MIKAVIFDCFGVLTTDGWLAFRQKYLNNNTEALELAIASNKRVDAGLISYDQFIHDIAQLANVPDDIARRMIESNVANEELFLFIRDNLKTSYSIGLLSNAGDNWLDKLFDTWQVALFDEIVLSYQINAIKPDVVTYETIATKLGVLPEECIFVDDQPRYVTAAEDYGMHGVYFEDTASAIAKIKELVRA